MANKIKEIKGFFSGILSSFSSSDIKDDAASYSENIDSTDEDGVLKGSKEDSIQIEDSSIKTEEFNRGVFRKRGYKVLF